MAGKPPVNAYLSTQVKTASKDQLLLMLFDGAVKFATQAKTAMAEREFEASSNNCLRVQKIVTELMGSLEADTVAPDLYKNLMSLYSFCHKKMVSANIERNPAFVDEAIEILHQLRGVWKQAIDKVLEDFGGRLPTQEELEAQGVAMPAPKVPEAPQAAPAAAAPGGAFKPKIQIGQQAGAPAAAKPGAARPAKPAAPKPAPFKPAAAKPAASKPVAKPSAPAAKPAAAAPAAKPAAPAQPAAPKPFFKPKINLK